jgi:hypothetical protein
MYSNILTRRGEVSRRPKRMLPGRGEVPKRLFVWICGQVSNGRKYKWQEKKEMSGDGASDGARRRPNFGR